MKNILLTIIILLFVSFYSSCGNQSVQTLRTESDSIRYADSLAADSAVKIGYELKRAGLYYKRVTTEITEEN